MEKDNRRADCVRLPEGRGKPERPGRPMGREYRGPEVPRLALRAAEAAQALGVSEGTLWAWVRMGVVPCVRIGGVNLFPVRAMQEWLTRAVCLGPLPPPERDRGDWSGT